MENASSFCENAVSASQPCPSGQTPGNSSLRYMQLPPVGLANISGSIGGTKNPWAMVQKLSASIALPFPTLVQVTIRLRLRGADQQCCLKLTAAFLLHSVCIQHEPRWDTASHTVELNWHFRFRPCFPSLLVSKAALSQSF